MMKTIIIVVCSAGAYLALVIALTAYCSYRLLMQRRNRKAPCKSFLIFSSCNYYRNLKILYPPKMNYVKELLVIIEHKAFEINEPIKDNSTEILMNRVCFYTFS